MLSERLFLPAHLSGFLRTILNDLSWVVFFVSRFVGGFVPFKRFF